MFTKGKNIKMTSRLQKLNTFKQTFCLSFIVLQIYHVPLAFNIFM